MPYSGTEDISASNPRPVQEVAGSYNRYEPISATNPLPVMEVEGGEYSGYGDVSQTNPQPVAIIADSGTYSRYENESDTNALPVKFIEGQSYDPRQDISETNPWPVVVVSGGGGEEYEGPLDLVAGAVAAYGIRALSSAMLGQQIFTILREGDAETLPVSADAVTGEVNTAAIDTFIGEDTGRWGEAIDQTGNAHLVEGGFSGPVWDSSAVNGKPAFLGGDAIGTDGAPVTLPNGAATVFMVCKGGVAAKIAASGMNVFAGSAAWNDLYDGVNEAGADYPGLIDDEDFHIIESAWEFGQNVYLVDGELLTPTDSFDNGEALDPITNEILLVVDVGNALSECIVYPTVLSAPNRLAIRQNMAAFYSITLAP